MAVNLDDLKRILTAAAGDGDGVELNTDVLDADFEDLGYDSLALLETASRLERQYSVSLDDDAFMAAKTPRSLLALVNSAPPKTVAQ